MSRSYQHSPFCGITTCRSEKEYKVRAHRRLRVAERTMLEDDPEPRLEDVSDVWSFGKDGKQRITPGWLARQPGVMRK